MRRVAALLLWSPVLVCAQDLGSHGTSYKITEPDTVQVIKQRLQAKIESGEWERLVKENQARAKERVVLPPPVEGLGTAILPRTFWFDPAFRVERDIRTPDGQLIVAQGTMINPLDYAPFRKTWVFVDGREPKQTEWAQGKLADPNVQPIFVAGKWMDYWREWQRRTYFDQGGILVKKLGIHATPALVRQDGNRIRIDEIVLP